MLEARDTEQIMEEAEGWGGDERWRQKPEEDREKMSTGDRQETRKTSGAMEKQMRSGEVCNDQVRMAGLRKVRMTLERMEKAERSVRVLG